MALPEPGDEAALLDLVSEVALLGEAVADQGLGQRAAPAMMETVPPDSQRCAAITKSGARCKRRARAGSVYCHLHG